MKTYKNSARRIKTALTYLLFCVYSLSVNSIYAQTVSTGYQFLNPKPNASYVSIDSRIILRPGATIASSSVKNDVLSVTGSKSGTHTGTIALANDKKTLNFSPSSAFSEDEIVQVTFAAQLRSENGDTIPGISYTFRTCISSPDIDSALSVKAMDCLPLAPVKPSVGKISSLPGNYPQLVTNSFTSTAPGYLFLSFYPYLIIQDNENVPVFYRYAGSSLIYDFKLQSTGELTYFTYPVTCLGLDNNYNITQAYTTGNGFTPDVHDLKLLPDGSYYIFGKRTVTMDLSSIVTGGQTAAKVIDGALQEYDASGNLIFQWDGLENYNITDVDSHVDLTAVQVDFTHFNTVEIDTDGNILISPRNLDEITKINRSTGAIMWRLGGENNQFTFINDDRGFSRQHDVRRLSNGNISVFDNGVYHTTVYSRMVEYQVDEVNKTVTLEREYTHNGTVYSPAEGNVQELANGGRLIGWGNVCVPAITEIDSNNSIVYELSTATTADEYRAFRFSWSTGLFTTSADTINFGCTAVGSSTAKYLTIYNPQDSILKIDEIYCKESDVFFTTASLPIAIPANSSIMIPIFFEPSDTTPYQASFNLRINGTYNYYPQLIARQVILTGNLSANSVSSSDYTSSYSFSLSQNYPNPFNPKTTIRYSLPEKSDISINIYNQLGQKVEALFEGEKEAGQYTISWNAEHFASGVYFYELAAGNHRDVKKLILLK